MTRDAVLTAALVLAFALLVTAHVTIVAGLLARPPRWRAVLAAFVAPLAPLWGWFEGMVVRSILWLVFAVAYLVTRWMASR
jgi:hypothetical protein